MTRLLYVFWLLSIAFIARGQIGVEYSIGYGNYKMEEMKAEMIRIKEELRQELPLAIGIIDDFPGYITHTVGFTYRLDGHEFGTNFVYMNTAGKAAYSDYSGELVDKIRINAYRVGGSYRNYFYRLALSKSNSLAFFCEISPGFTFTKIRTNAYIKTKLSEIDFDEKYGFNSTATNFSILPQLGLKFRLPYRLGLQLLAGYDIETKGSLNQNKSVKVDWSGIRIGGGLSFILPFRAVKSQ